MGSLRPSLAFLVPLLAAGLVTCSAPELQAIRWNTVEASPDQRLLIIGYAADRCQTFDHAEVAYDENSLVVTLFVRRNEASCLAIRFSRTVVVPLHESLAGRQVENPRPQ